ncbi:MAG: enoyl-CoA hydratase-related protein [Candidatus Thermoplasmatota archaeon]|nr:enoyl-CoA hydratase-related protein [Candidatus Thermoplasmatota archaeon]
MKNLKFEKEKYIGIITICRPPMNALNTEVLLELKALLEEVEKSQLLKALIITGEGDKAFVAGADIKELKDKNAAQALEFAKIGQEVLDKIENLPMPVIAAVNGYALGGGTELALACDFVIASSNAKFGQPEVKLGIIPGFGGTQRLARLLNKNYAKHLIFTGETIDANEAYRIGLANKVVAQKELLNAAKELAAKIQSCRVAISYAKEAINKGLEVPLEKGLELERNAFSKCFETQDSKEGLEAFLQKRVPKFQGI